MTPKSCPPIKKPLFIKRPEIIKEITDAVRVGCYDYIAAQAAGIDPRAFVNWMNWGEAGKEPYVQVYESVKKARGEMERRNLTIITKASDKSWQAAAWLLERTSPERFGVRGKYEHTGKDGGPLHMTITDLVASHEKGSS